VTSMSWRGATLIQVGQVLDKYELLERVGQGGMAIVYRGLDRTLKRTVAVKILHKHLSDYQEARDRFEREAQAVAKLRHENILEIFDYAAKEGSESYIVTEFIDGHTLKQFVTDRPITFPEIGAMILLQVCRALAHAHAGGILHRDVKPENIMIRSDGVVKLMDFGISHMVDLERLTVTGQLLGSPAYMAPEHVEGRPIDFRTDVFAAGIVLYQLTVGKLPFEGKNPHEVLKRIAECKFVDPRQANPRIGNRLGRIILRAMAAAPGDRFPAIGDMVSALEAYLEESGLAKDKVVSELARYFATPAPYEHALKERLIDHLARRGQELLDGDRAAALDVFDRVLTIDPENAKVLDILDGLSRRTRLKHVALGLGAAALIAGGWTAYLRLGPTESAPVLDPPSIGRVAVGEHHVEHEIAPPPAIDAPEAAPGDAAPLAVMRDAGEHAVALDGPPAAVGVPTQVHVSPSSDSEYRRDGERDWHPVPADGLIALTLEHDTRLVVRNRTGCCQEEGDDIHPGDDATIALSFLPAHIIPKCSVPRVAVQVDGTGASVGERFAILFGKTIDTSKQVKVEFLGEHVDPTPLTVTVHASQDQEVACVPR